MKAMKKILTALLAVTMALSFVTAAVAMEGDGTAGNPLQIVTSDDLLAFAERVEDGEMGLWAVLTTDIKVDDWQTIGQLTGYSGYSTSGPFQDSNAPYSGTFDGGGHTLTLSFALDDTQTTFKKGSGIALFHTIDTDGVVKNLNLDVDFWGYSAIAGAAVRNYGTIERVTVEGSLKAAHSNSFIGGIASWNGCKTINDEVVPGKILYCVNKATLSNSNTYTSGNLTGKNTGVSNAGGICGSFLGEMRYCVNLGKIYFTATATANTGTGGLFTLRSSVTSSNDFQLIVSDCYNAGTMYCVGTSANGMMNGGLFGGGQWVSTYLNIPDLAYTGALKISNVFNYGPIINPYRDESPNNVWGSFSIISGVNTGYSEIWVEAIYSNIYYLPGIGGRLFNLSTLVGGNGYGTARIKSVIKGKTADEFKTAELAALLNNGRRGDDAPWEYIEGNDYPTLKFENTTGTPGIDYIPVALDIIVDYGYGGTIGAAGTEGLAIEQCTVAAIDGYRIDTISVDGVQLENVHGLTEYTTTVSPKTAIFATFSYFLNFNAPAGGTLSVSRGGNALTSGSIVHALEVLNVTYDGPGRLVFTGLEAAGNGEYTVTARRTTSGPTITAVSVGGGTTPTTPVAPPADGGSTGSTGGSTNTGGGTPPVDSDTTAVAVPDGSVTVPSDTVIDESTGVATLPGGGITLADGATALIVPPDTTIDLDTGIITVTQSGGLTLADGTTELTVPPDTTIDSSTGIINVTHGGAVTVPASDVSDGLGIEFVVPSGTTIDPVTGIMSVAADAGALTLPGTDGATGSDQDNIQVIVPDGTTIDPATGTVTAVKGGWVVLPGSNRVIDTPQDMRRGATLEDDKEFNVTPGTTVDPYTGSVTVKEGGEITLPDGTTTTVAPGTTIDPLTGEITPPRDEAGKGAENPGGGCDAGTAGFALLAMAMIAASAARKKTR